MKSQVLSDGQRANEQFFLLHEGRDAGDILFHVSTVDTNVGIDLQLSRSTMSDNIEQRRLARTTTSIQRSD